MATATKEDLSKLSPDDLRERFNDLKAKAFELESLESRGPDQDAELVDFLDEADQIMVVLARKDDEELKRRLKRLNDFDSKPKPRKAGGANAPVENFASMGERLQAVYRYRATGQMDQRLRNALGANEATPSEGGFLVGSDSETDLMSKVYGSPILSRIPRTPISANSDMLLLKLLKETSRADGSRQGGVQAYWKGEATSATASQREYEEIKLLLEKLLATSYATSELLEDAPALEAELGAGFVEEITFKAEDAIFNGDGIGKPLGILNSPAKVTVSVETGQTTLDPLNFDNVAKMYARLHPRSVLNAIWSIDQSLMPSMMTMGVAVGTGGVPVYLPPNGAAGAPFGTLLGLPIVPCEYTQAKNTEGDIILWDPTQYRIIEKGGIRGASSVHVAFLTDETAFRWTYRVNGAPKWRSALTPKNGGDTLSTIVTLATRT